MKKIIILIIGIILFCFTIYSFINKSCLEVVLILDLLFAFYILFKIYRKYRGHVIIDESKRNKLPGNIEKVSVVIPNYNYAHYIEDRIDSVLKQTYPIYELIILDDKSSDDSVKVIRNKIDSIKRNNPDLKVEFIANKTNSGNVFKQWQKAFEVSTGDYLWIAEADDLCDKDFLNVTMQGFSDRDVILSYTESTGINKNGDVINNDFRSYTDTYNRKVWNKDFVMDGKLFLDKSLVINNSILNVSAVVFKKGNNTNFLSCLDEAQQYKLSGDWYFYSKVLLHGKIAYSTDSLNMHRIHDNSVTNKTNNELKYKEIVLIQNSIKEDVKISLMSNHYSRLYRNAVKRLK